MSKRISSISMAAVGRRSSEVAECVYGDCSAKPSAMLEVPLCDRHAILAYRAVKAAIEAAPNQWAVVAFNGTGNAKPLHKTTTRGFVYFLEVDNLIKIGFATNVAERMKALPKGRVLATIPGTLVTEGQMHAKFAAARDHLEWFRKSPELLSYIDTIAA